MVIWNKLLAWCFFLSFDLLHSTTFLVYTGICLFRFACTPWFLLIWRIPCFQLPSVSRTPTRLSRVARLRSFTFIVSCSSVTRAPFSQSLHSRSCLFIHFNVECVRCHVQNMLTNGNGTLELLKSHGTISNTHYYTTNNTICSMLFFANRFFDPLALRATWCVFVWVCFFSLLLFSVVRSAAMQRFGCFLRKFRCHRQWSLGLQCWRRVWNSRTTR